MKIRLAAPLQQDSIVDGEGIRTVIWTQGCTHNCFGCHNPETHDMRGGELVDVDEINEQIRELEGQDGITFSGGDPMFQIDACLHIAKTAKECGLNVWCYTGFTFEELMKMSDKNQSLIEFLKLIDVLIDGKFMIEQKSFNIKFRGSRNQRIIDVKKSLKNKKAVLIPRLMNDTETLNTKKEEIFI